MQRHHRGLGGRSRHRSPAVAVAAAAAAAAAQLQPLRSAKFLGARTPVATGALAPRGSPLAAAATPTLASTPGSSDAGGSEQAQAQAQTQADENAIALMVCCHVELPC